MTFGFAQVGPNEQSDSSFVLLSNFSNLDVIKINVRPKEGQEL